MGSWRVLLWMGAALVSSLILTSVARRYAVVHANLDIPNERSSHTEPTPRGGGLSIVTVVLAGIMALWYMGVIPSDTAVAFLGGGGLVAMIGWVDDHGGVHPLIRVTVHFVAAVWALWWLGGYSTIQIGERALELGPAGAVLAVVGIVWLINLYNFMDGSDGLAAGEGTMVGLFGGVLLLASGNLGIGMVALLVAAACTGFGIWNWPPAKIFMGDVGSGFLGYTFAVLAISSEMAGGPSVVWWALLLGVFVFDATITLLRRMLMRERWYAPHRSHAYQRAIQAGFTHRQVLLIVLIVNGVLGISTVIGIHYPSVGGWAASGGWALLAVIYVLTEHRRPMYP